MKYSQGQRSAPASEPASRWARSPTRAASPRCGKSRRDAVKRGATLATGGERIGTSGNFFKPTVLLDPPLDGSVFNDEPFGPMAAIAPREKP